MMRALQFEHHLCNKLLSQYPITYLMDVWALHPREAVNGHLPSSQHAILVSWEEPSSAPDLLGPFVQLVHQSVALGQYCRELILFGSGFRETYSRIMSTIVRQVLSQIVAMSVTDVELRSGVLTYPNSLITDLTLIACPCPGRRLRPDTDAH